MLGHRDTKNADRLLGHRDTETVDMCGQTDAKIMDIWDAGTLKMQTNRLEAFFFSV